MYEHSPLLHTVMDNAAKYADKTAIVQTERTITYSSLAENIRKAASLLKDKSLQAGDKIILSARKEVEYVYIYFAAQMLGVTNVIVDAESNEDRLHYIEEEIRPTYCFGYKSDRFPSILFSEINLEGMTELNGSDKTLSTDNIAEILFTTGTTGNPKGVCLSYDNVYASAVNINGYIGNTADDVELLALPICHSFGMGRIRCNLILGATLVILDNFANVRAFLKAIEQYCVTGFGVVPGAWAYIRKISGTRIAKYADQIRYIEIGSAAMPMEAKKELLSLFPYTMICMHYGLTEASRNCFLEFHDIEHLGSVGKPVCDKVDVKIIDLEGREVEPGKEGELCVKGNMVMARYLRDEDNAYAFYGEYFRTGDCGYKDADGYIYLLGREKELINVGGEKVSPMEVEDAVISLGVGDCVCVPMKDEKGIMGELVFCYILKGSTTMTFEEIAEKLSHKLEVYKRPVAYGWIDKIPMTASGKKQRLQIK